MKTIVFNAIITAAALATVVGAYSTLPEGRVLNEQEKMALGGVGAGDICTKCDISDISCETVKSEHAEGDSCKGIRHKQEFECKSYPGTKRVNSGTKTKATDLVTTNCSTIVWTCNAKDDQGKTLPNPVWKSKEREADPASKCGVYSSCSAEADPKCAPDLKGE